MPPIPKIKLPHGLKKDPRLMSGGEKGIFGLLAVSIGLGVFQLATSPWGEQHSGATFAAANEDTEHSGIGSTFGHERIKKMGGGDNVKLTSFSELSQDATRTTSLGVDDGMTKLAATAPTPKVNDGVTGIQYGDGLSK